MEKDTFDALHEKLVEFGLKDGRKIVSKLKLAVYMWVLGTGSTLNKVAERFQYSTSTVHNIIQEVAEIFYRHSNFFILPPDASVPFDRNFPDALGALDGTHIPISVRGPVGAYRDADGLVSTNVLACVNRDMTFSYVLAGWEGSAHDCRVLADAMTKGLPRVPGKYWLADAGYGLKLWLLTPYRGVRYHLKEFGPDALQPQNAREIYNLRHSQSRNVIERSFGVLKKRFPILRRVESYERDLQTKIIMSCFMIHNFIRRFNANDSDEWLNLTPDEVINARDPPMWFQQAEPDAETLRDNMATNFWNQFTGHA